MSSTTAIATNININNISSNCNSSSSSGNSNHIHKNKNSSKNSHARHGASTPKHSKRHRTKAVVIDYEAESNKTLASICNLSVGQVSDFREIFRQIDLDNNGSIDQNELKQLLTSIHGDENLCSEQYVRELIGRVKDDRGGAGEADQADLATLEFTFEELMLSILKRPSVSYTKAQVLDAFATLAGCSAPYGHINTDVLSRAIQYGNGGIPHGEAEDMLAMVEHTPTASFDYEELCELLMGHNCQVSSSPEKGGNKDRDSFMSSEEGIRLHASSMAKGGRGGGRKANVSFLVPKHILDMNRGPTSKISLAKNSLLATSSTLSTEESLSDTQSTTHTSGSKETAKTRKRADRGTSGASPSRIQSKKSKNLLKRSRQQRGKKHPQQRLESGSPSKEKRRNTKSRPNDSDTDAMSSPRGGDRKGGKAGRAKLKEETLILPPL